MRSADEQGFGCKSIENQHGLVIAKAGTKVGDEAMWGSQIYQRKGKGVQGARQVMVHQ